MRRPRHCDGSHGVPLRKCGNDVEFGLSRESGQKNRGQNEEVFFHKLKFVSTVSTENKFKLQENRIDVATSEEKRVFDEVVVVLQTDFRELGWIPGQVRRDARPGLPTDVVGEPGIFGVEIIAANPGDP